MSNFHYFDREIRMDFTSIVTPNLGLWMHMGRHVDF